MTPDEYTQSIEMLRTQFPAFQQYEEKIKTAREAREKEIYQHVRDHGASVRILLDTLMLSNSKEYREEMCHRIHEADDELLNKILDGRKA
jgi:hypothetical protein